QNDGGQTEVTKIVGNTALQYFHDVGSAGDVNSKIFPVHLVRNSLNSPDQLPGVTALGEHDYVAGLAVLCYQKPAPEGTLHRVLIVLRTSCQTFDRAHAVDRFDLSSQFLNPLEVARRRNVPGGDCQNELRLRRETLLDLFGLPESGIARGKEKILFHHRLKIDKYDHQHEQDGRDREHLPMRAERDPLLPNCREKLQRISTGHFGSACIKERP